jgi:hypothetical protein
VLLDTGGDIWDRKLAGTLRRDGRWRSGSPQESATPQPSNQNERDSLVDVEQERTRRVHFP